MYIDITVSSDIIYYDIHMNTQQNSGVQMELVLAQDIQTYMYKIVISV